VITEWEEIRGEYDMEIELTGGLNDLATRNRQWDDYMVVVGNNDGSKFIRSYIERFNTVSYFNEYAGLLSFFFAMGQICAPFIRIPIHGTFMDCRVHVYWIQQSRTGKSIAWDFTDRLLEALEVDSESFTAGSDARLIGTVERQPITDENNRPTGEYNNLLIPGLLNGYKTMLFDEASILLNDAKAHFSDKILYLQQAMAPLGSRTNVLVKHLVGGSIRTPSGVSLWMTTYPPKDIMDHVLDKGFFQRVFLFQNDITLEQRQTTSEHRMGGLYTPVADHIMDYGDLAEYMQGCVQLVKERLWDAMGLEADEGEMRERDEGGELTGQMITEIIPRQAVWDALPDGEKEDAAMRHAHDIFSVSPGYHAAILNAVDDYYGLVHSIASETIRETAMTFVPNIENYTAIFANLIAVAMKAKVITEDHVMMASEIIFDNMHNLTIWLEQKQNFKDRKRLASERAAWMQAFNQCSKFVDESDGKERVKQSELLSAYGAQQCIANITAQRRFKSLREGGQALISKSGAGGRNFVMFTWGS
jgi:hypothetical protein